MTVHWRHEPNRRGGVRRRWTSILCASLALALSLGACSTKAPPKDAGEVLRRADPLNTPPTEPSEYVGPDDFTPEVTPTPSVNATGTATPVPQIKPADGYLAFKLTCFYVEGSPQGSTSDMITRLGISTDPAPGFRYSDTEANPALKFALRGILDTGIGTREVVRFKAQGATPNVLHLWVTRTRTPDDYPSAKKVAAAMASAIGFMSSVRPPASGGCTAQPAEPLPPELESQSKDANGWS